MLHNRVRMAIDYNRGQPASVRLLHAVAAALAAFFHPLWQWASQPQRRWWARPTVALGLTTLALLPLDALLLNLARSIPLGGDPRRELEAWQQFGALGSLLFVAALVFLLDPARARRTLDLFAAAALASLACLALKITTGRLRPLHGDSLGFLGTWGAHPIDHDGAWILRQSTDLAQPGVEQLWSMPSAHTAGAAVLAVFLSRIFPKLTPIAWTLVVIVGLARVLFGAHWPSDITMGALVGLLTGRLVIDHCLGVRALDLVWGLLVDPRARPAYPDRLAPLPLHARSTPTPNIRP